MKLLEMIQSQTYYDSIKSLCDKYKFKNGLEIGMAIGQSTVCFLNNTDGHLTTIDINDNFGVVNKIKQEFGDRWEFIVGDSGTELPKLYEKYDYIYIDGDHLFAGVLSDIEKCWPLLGKGAVMLLDDYGITVSPHQIKQAVDHWNNNMKLKMYHLEGNPNGAVYFIKE